MTAREAQEYAGEVAALEIELRMQAADAQAARPSWARITDRRAAEMDLAQADRLEQDAAQVASMRRELGVT